MLIIIANRDILCSSRFNDVLAGFSRGVKAGFKHGAVTGAALGALLWAPGACVMEGGMPISFGNVARLHGAFALAGGVLFGTIEGVYGAATAVFKKQHVK